MTLHVCYDRFASRAGTDLLNDDVSGRRRSVFQQHFARKENGALRRPGHVAGLRSGLCSHAGDERKRCDGNEEEKTQGDTGFYRPLRQDEHTLGCCANINDQ